MTMAESQTNSRRHRERGSATVAAIEVRATERFHEGGEISQPRHLRLRPCLRQAHSISHVVPARSRLARADEGLLLNVPVKTHALEPDPRKILPSCQCSA